MFNVLQFISVL